MGNKQGRGAEEAWRGAHGRLRLDWAVGQARLRALAAAPGCTAAARQRPGERGGRAGRQVRTARAPRRKGAAAAERRPPRGRLAHAGGAASACGTAVGRIAPRRGMGSTPSAKGAAGGGHEGAVPRGLVQDGRNGGRRRRRCRMGGEPAGEGEGVTAVAGYTGRRRGQARRRGGRRTRRGRGAGRHMPPSARRSRCGLHAASMPPAPLLPPPLSFRLAASRQFCDSGHDRLERLKAQPFVGDFFHDQVGP